MLKYCPMLQHSGLLVNIWNVVRPPLWSCLRHQRRCVRHTSQEVLHHCSSCPPATGAREGLRAVLRELHKLTCCSTATQETCFTQRKLESADERKRCRHAPHCARCAPSKSSETHPRLLRHIWKVHAEARDTHLAEHVVSTGAVRIRNWRCAACTATAGCDVPLEQFQITGGGEAT